MENVSIRLRKGLIREALEKGLTKLKLEMAIEMFSEGKISTTEAAEIADLGVGEMMDELVKRGIRQEITKEDLEGSLKRAMKVVK